MIELELKQKNLMHQVKIRFYFGIKILKLVIPLLSLKNERNVGEK